MRRLATEAGAYAAEINTAFEHGGDGATALAEAAVAAATSRTRFDFAYTLDAPIEEKIRLIATRVYGADGVELLPAGEEEGRGLGEHRARASSRSAWRRRTSRSRTIRRSRTRRPGFTVTGPRPAAVHRRRLDRRAVRRHDDDARPREDARGLRHRHRRVGRDGRAVLSRCGRAAAALQGCSCAQDRNPLGGLRPAQRSGQVEPAGAHGLRSPSLRELASALTHGVV